MANSLRNKEEEKTNTPREKQQGRNLRNWELKESKAYQITFSTSLFEFQQREQLS